MGEAAYEVKKGKLRNTYMYIYLYIYVYNRCICEFCTWINIDSNRNEIVTVKRQASIDIMEKR